MSDILGAICSNDGVVIVSDSDSDPLQSTSVLPINDLCVAAVFREKDAVNDFLTKYVIPKKPTTVQSVIDIIETELKLHDAKYSKSNLSFFVAGYENENPIYFGFWFGGGDLNFRRINKISHFINNVEDLAIYIVSKIYSEQMNLEELKNLIIFVSLQLMKVFGINSLFEITTISKNGVHTLSRKDIVDRLSIQDRKDNKLKKLFSDFFYNGDFCIMTLAFALRGSNGLVLGADSRMSSENGSTDTSTKFLQVNREIGILTYGIAEVGYKSINTIVDEVNGYSDFSATVKPRIVHFSEIVRKTKEICQKTYNNIATELKKKQPELTDRDLSTGFILAGYDANESNQFKICHLESPSFEIEERPSDIIAAQWHISQFLSNHFYYPEMDVEQLKRLANFMLIETGVVSTSVGGRLKIATVTLENGFQLLNEKEIQKIISENQHRFAKYRRILLDNLRT